ncbi:unnamed protein product [Chondrus crispus]|uniref:Uncharacterized protein n=1 Tax=Chondrus crispus TaxID=2769 RepID=R7QQ35_CHOCR|nr:unnamed protein product [Chondrus crispus]CDF40234.1 unnamed protein product [Chondrus crispus]|eukprot:XP_005710528.1 unnamed protein product [Chondrus crispus]
MTAPPFPLHRGEARRDGEPPAGPKARSSPDRVLGVGGGVSDGARRRSVQQFANESGIVHVSPSGPRAGSNEGGDSLFKIARSTRKRACTKTVGKPAQWRPRDLVVRTFVARRWARRVREAGAGVARKRSESVGRAGEEGWTPEGQTSPRMSGVQVYSTGATAWAAA